MSGGVNRRKQTSSGPSSSHWLRPTQTASMGEPQGFCPDRWTHVLAVPTTAPMSGPHRACWVVQCVCVPSPSPPSDSGQLSPPPPEASTDHLIFTSPACPARPAWLPRASVVSSAPSSGPARGLQSFTLCLHSPNMNFIRAGIFASFVLGITLSPPPHLDMCLAHSRGSLCLCQRMELHPWSEVATAWLRVSFQRRKRETHPRHGHAGIRPRSIAPAHGRKRSARQCQTALQPTLAVRAQPYLGTEDTPAGPEWLPSLCPQRRTLCKHPHSRPTASTLRGNQRIAQDGAK